jgi:hypothetical protein
MSCGVMSDSRPAFETAQRAFVVKVGARPHGDLREVLGACVRDRNEFGKDAAERLFGSEPLRCRARLGESDVPVAADRMTPAAVENDYE